MQVMRRIKHSVTRRFLLGCGLVLLIVLALAGVSYARMALGYYRFMRSVEAASKENTVARGPWPQLEDVGLPCHGFNGNPASQRYARLAGQPQAYLAEQLTAFATGARGNPTMSPLALNLSVDEVKRLSTYFAAQRIAANAAFTADPVRLQKGENLARTGNCTSCHGARLEGHAAVARLAGQGRDYLIQQLTDFRSGTRRDPQGVMTLISAALSDDDIDNLAQFLAHDTE
jgi:cytochrome c553